MIKDITYFVLDFNPVGDKVARENLTLAVETLRDRHDKALAADFFLVNQGSQHSTHRSALEYLALQNDFHYLDLRTNLGISRGINFCVNVARSRYVCLVTSDCIVTRGMDTNLVSYLEREPKCLLAMPLSQKSDVDYQQFIPKEQYGAADVEINQPSISPVIAHEFSVAMWPKRAFDIVGYYNERFKACFENLDWALRCYLSGHNTAIIGNSFVWHYHGGCRKSGAAAHTYDGYIKMDSEYDQTKLRPIWDEEWPGINWDTLYRPQRLKGPRPNIPWKKLGYIQDVNY